MRKTDYTTVIFEHEEVRQRMAQIRNRFKILLAQKEAADGRKYTYDDIRGLTGVSPTTLSNYAQGNVTRFDEPTLVALCNWFGCELAELIEYTPAQSQQNTLTSCVIEAAVG